MELIDKAAVVAEINRQHKKLMTANNIYGAQFVLGFRQACRQIIDFLNTLEVKEVDLEKEIDDWYNTMGIPVTTDALKETARHFFELGLKAQKEDTSECSSKDDFIRKVYEWLKGYAFVDDENKVHLPTLLHDFLKDSRTI